MDHSFNVEIATKFGLEEAILFQHIQYWVEKNKANEKNFYNGRYWTYNSTKAFEKMFPYMTQRTIARKLQNLIDKGLILTGNYNENKYDRTLWYSLTDYAESILPRSQINDTEMTNGNDKMANAFDKMANGSDQNGKPIPNNKPNIKTNIKERMNERNYATIINSQIEDGELESTLYEFLKMRQLIKKPMTDRALEMLIHKLKRMSDGNPKVAIEILNQSILNNWQDIYSLKEETENGLQKFNETKSGKPIQREFTQREYTKDELKNCFTNLDDVEI